MLQKIIEFSLRQKFLVLLIIVILSVFGIKSLITSPKEFLPDLSSPIVSAVTEKPGLAPQEVENLISRPVENSLQSLPNVVSVRSQSTSGLSIVTVTFKWGTDYYLAQQWISRSLSDVTSKLPLGTNSPFLLNAASRLGEVLQYYVKSDSSTVMDLRELADYDIRLRLQSVPGVARINNVGGEVRQFQVLIDLDKLRYFKVGLNQIIEALKANNLNFSGGIVQQGPIEFAVRGLARIYSVKDIEQVVVTTHNGVPVYVKDVAIVQEGAQFRRGILYVGGKEAVAGTVTKQFGVDTQPVIEGIIKGMKELKTLLPSSVSIEPYFNQSELITVSMQNLKEALVIGGITVLIIVILFLTNFRIALIIAAALPVSVLTTFIFMRFFHVSVNVMSLGGIAVGLGIMIDASIVGTENIYRWMQLYSHDPFEATLRGTLEICRPIIFSTSIIIVVFAPLMFLPGFEGKLFMPFAFTIIVSMLTGFILSLTLTPLLCHSLLGRTVANISAVPHELHETPHHGLKNIETKESWLTNKFLSIYDPLLKKALAAPKKAMLIVLGIVALTFILIPFIGSELLPPFDENAVLLKIWMPAGTSLVEASKITRQIIPIVKQAPDVKEVISMVGRAEGGQETEGMVGFAENYIQMVDRKKRKKTISEIVDYLREKTAVFPGVIITFQTPLNDRIEESISGTPGQLAVKIFGTDYDILAQKSKEMKEIMARIPTIKDLLYEQTSGLPVINILVDRYEAGRYGLTPEQIASVVETAFEGETATTVLKDIKEFSVFVQLQERFRNDPKKIGSILIETPSGASVKLSQVSKIWEDTGPILIKRENLQRYVQLTCNIAGGDINRVVSEIKSKVSKLNLPEGYRVVFGGNYERQKELTGKILTMIIMSLIVVFMLLLIAFNSIWQAILIIFTIPLALMGGVWAMFFTVETFNVSSLIGLVAHFGLTVQTGVILVEYINGLIKEGKPLHDALIIAGKTRMRPVLMTALAASLGVLPLALGIGAGAEIQQPMAIVLIGGLLVSAPMILVILPVLYGQIYKFFNKTVTL